MAKDNASIARYLQEKNGQKSEPKPRQRKVEDLGANVPKSEDRQTIIGLDADFELDV